MKQVGSIVVACCVLHYFCRLHSDRRLVNPATDNTDDMTNDNDVQFPIQARQLLEVASQRAGTLNRHALFEYWLENVTTNETYYYICGGIINIHIFSTK